MPRTRKNIVSANTDLITCPLTWRERNFPKAIYGEIYRYVGHRCIIHGALGADPIHLVCDAASTDGGPVRRKRSTERESSQAESPGERLRFDSSSSPAYLPVRDIAGYCVILLRCTADNTVERSRVKQPDQETIAKRTRVPLCVCCRQTCPRLWTNNEQRGRGLDRVDGWATLHSIRQEHGPANRKSCCFITPPHVRVRWDFETNLSRSDAGPASCVAGPPIEQPRPRSVLSPLPLLSCFLLLFSLFSSSRSQRNIVGYSTDAL